MKTIKKDEVIKRVSDDKAVSLVRDGWSYTSKSEWKTLVRDINKKPKGEERDMKDDVTGEVETKPTSRKHYKQKKRLKMVRQAEQNG